MDWNISYHKDINSAQTHLHLMNFIWCPNGFVYLKARKRTWKIHADFQMYEENSRSKIWGISLKYFYIFKGY